MKKILSVVVYAFVALSLALVAAGCESSGGKSDTKAKAKAPKHKATPAKPKVDPLKGYFHTAERDAINAVLPATGTAYGKIGNKACNNQMERLFKAAKYAIATRCQAADDQQVAAALGAVVKATSALDVSQYNAACQSAIATFNTKVNAEIAQWTQLQVIWKNYGQGSAAKSRQLNKSLAALNKDQQRFSATTNALAAACAPAAAPTKTDAVPAK